MLAGKRVIKWRHLELGLSLPQLGARLPLQPLAFAAQQQPGQQGAKAGSTAGSEPLEAVGPGSLGTSPPASGEPAAFGAAHEARPAGLASFDDDEGTIPAGLASEGQAPLGSGEAGLGHEPRFAGYSRARLHPWLASVDTGGSPSGGGAATAGAAEARSNSSGEGDSLGAGPASLLDVRLEGFEFSVPHDREPGPTQRYAELYFKALQQVSSVCWVGVDLSFLAHKKRRSC